MMMFKSIILILLLFVGCLPTHKNKNYLYAIELFLEFDNVISPEEYAKTIYFYKDEENLWRNKTGSLVNINIPYKNNFFSYSNSFMNNNRGNEKGINSRYISKYKNGIQINEYYELDNIIIDSISYPKSIYIIFLNRMRVVNKTELYSSDGILIKESKKDFLQQIRRVID